MAHQVEQMMYVGVTPWHGLGRRLMDPPTIDEAIVQAGLDWKVGLKPLFTEDGDRVTHQATYRETDGKILGIVGPRYHPLQNDKAFRFFEPFVDSNEVNLETAGSLAEGKKVWILAKIAGDPLEIANDDIVNRYLLLSNSHDGTTSVNIGFTPIRVVCNNTLSFAHSHVKSNLLKIRHTASMESTLDQIQEIINVANQQFEATASQYRELASKLVNSEEKLREYIKVALELVPKPGEELSTRASNKIESVVELFEHGRGNDLTSIKGTYWAAYNAVNEHLNYYSNKSADKRMNSLWFGDNARKNAHALETALQMAA